MYRIKLSLAGGAVLEGASTNIREAFLAYKGAITEGTESGRDYRVELFASTGKLIAVIRSDNFREIAAHNPSKREIELARLLDVAACPINCEGGAYRDPYGDIGQCQFCYERKVALDGGS